ncbi:hypothetical protein DL768_007642 [Monosporascus sp. mg162]|nr:hypothetical protein DL768_007642 [Monosporascus sp. mg162]
MIRWWLPRGPEFRGAWDKEFKIYEQTFTHDGSAEWWPPTLSKTSKASCIDADGLLADIQEIEYSTEDDAIIDQWCEKTSVPPGTR